MINAKKYGDLILHPDLNMVIIRANRVKLTPKEMGVLELLSNQHGITLKRKTILDKVWGSDLANDQGLTQTISRLRMILSDSPEVSIITVPKKGYQLQLDNTIKMKPSLNRRTSRLVIFVLIILILLICYLMLIQVLGIRFDIQET